MLLRVQRNNTVLTLHNKIPTASSLSVRNEPEYAVRRDTITLAMHCVKHSNFMTAEMMYTLFKSLRSVFIKNVVVEINEY